jgi:UDP-glucose 4-epimerase
MQLMKTQIFDTAVVGGRGYIGRRLVKKLTDNGEDVGVVDKNDSSDPIKQARSLILLLGQISPGIDYQKELDDLRQILEGINFDITKTVMYTSTVLVYGNTTRPACETDELRPVGDYAKFKVECERLIHMSAKRHPEAAHKIARLANVYGGEGNKGLIGVLFKKIANNELQIQLNGTGTQTRDYIYVDDVINAIAIIKDHYHKNDIVNVSCGKSYSIREVIDVLNTCLKRKIHITWLNNKIEEIQSNTISNRKLISIYKLKPKITLNEGIKMTL